MNPTVDRREQEWKNVKDRHDPLVPGISSEGVLCVVDEFDVEENGRDTPYLGFVATLQSRVCRDAEALLFVLLGEGLFDHTLKLLTPTNDLKIFRVLNVKWFLYALALLKYLYNNLYEYLDVRRTTVRK